MLDKTRVVIKNLKQEMSARNSTDFGTSVYNAPISSTELRNLLKRLKNK